MRALALPLAVTGLRLTVPQRMMPPLQALPHPLKSPPRLALQRYGAFALLEVRMPRHKDAASDGRVSEV